MEELPKCVICKEMIEIINGKIKLPSCIKYDSWNGTWTHNVCRNEYEEKLFLKQLASLILTNKKMKK